MENTEKTLVLVEGTSDKDFFTSFFGSIAPKTEVRPNIHPDNASSKRQKTDQLTAGKNVHESKGALLCHIKSDISQLRDGHYKNMLYIVDADITAHGQGYHNTYKRFSDGFIAEGYAPDKDTIKPKCLHVFTHAELPSIALWIMPDNCEDGVFEGWIKTCAKKENALTVACTTVASITPPLQEDALNAAGTTEAPLTPGKFKPHNAIKAEIYTWLAWQEKPALSLEYALQNDLIDSKNPAFENFKEQLTQFIQRTEQEATQ